MQHQKAEIPCPVCSGSSRDVLYQPWIEIDDPREIYGAASGARGTQTLVRCRACDMIYESPRYPDEVILESYRSSEEGGHDSQYPMRSLSFLRALHSMEARLPGPGAKVLDIGTAGGAFLEAAEAFGWTATGLEPSAYLVESGRSRGLDLQQGTIDDHPFAASSFDVVCLWDVIEHLTDPLGALRAIRPLLKPEGILLINFPDIGTLPARLAGRRYWWILSVHLHHFTVATLGELCARAGFEVGHVQRYWQVLEFGYLEQMAAVLGVPAARLIHQLTPELLRRIRVPYYASQTTALATRSPA